MIQYLLKLAEDHWWFSISDSDLLLWAMGVAGKNQYDIKLVEPDVSPLQVQGPKSKKCDGGFIWILD